ncbi:hypothetical protein QYE76_022940 [Lolium multiflorum]|uniref:CCHC-type domain-containing protein n=1 Tax=Lolium multiflorum TaxID=4521 RepID=A0AAD8R9A0_LOLMU|nr:hypothetical protein QYE76_022940 [Lolium multiflorum]
MAKESPKWTNNTKPRHIRQGANVDKDQERRNPHGAWKKEEEGGRKRKKKREEEDRPVTDMEEYTEHSEEDASSSTADVEEHVELYTDYGSASIANMTDIEELYTDYGSASIANMDDIDELYIDTCSTSMDDMVEHHDEDDIDPTMHTADAPTYPYLANGATYEDRGPPRWHHHIKDIIWSIKSVPNMIAIDTLLQAPLGAASNMPSRMSHHLGMARTVIDSHHLMIVVDHHHLMVYIDILPHLIFDDTTQDMVMRQEDESLDMKTFLIRRLLPLAPPPQWPLPRHMPMDSDATSASNKATFHGNVPISYVSAKKLYFDELNAQVSKMPPLEDDLGGDGVEMVEHGKFPSTTEAHGDEQVEPTPICLIDELVPIPCEHESHLAHLSESDSELSDFHPICEFECFHLEDMSDTQSELREVDDRSMEDIAFANTLTSPSFVSSYVALGSTEDEFPLMETMYMVHEDDDISPCLLQDGHVDHMDPPTSTTPTSNESAYKGANVDKDQERRNPHGAWKKEEEGGRKRKKKREEEDQPVTARNRDMLCHTCGGKDHFKQDCPNCKVMIINDNDEYETGDDADPDAPEDDDYDSDGVDAFPSEARTIVVRALNVQPSASTQRCNLFQTKALVGPDKACKVIIDGGSCRNLASKELCAKLKLKYLPHPHPYYIQWLSDNGEMKEFSDVFPEEVPAGLPPLRGIEHQIDLIPGASLPNRAPYRTNPEETKEIQKQESHAGGLMGHFGREKTLLMLADHFYWPKMRRDVDRYVKRCITCNKSKSKLKPHGTRTTTSTATEHELMKRAIESYPNKDLTRGTHTKGYKSHRGPERRNTHGARKKEEGRKKEGRGRRGERRKAGRSQGRSTGPQAGPPGPRAGLTGPLTGLAGFDRKFRLCHPDAFPGLREPRPVTARPRIRYMEHQGPGKDETSWSREGEEQQNLEMNMEPKPTSPEERQGRKGRWPVTGPVRPAPRPDAPVTGPVNRAQTGPAPSYRTTTGPRTGFFAEARREKVHPEQSGPDAGQPAAQPAEPVQTPVNRPPNRPSRSRIRSNRAPDRVTQRLLRPRHPAISTTTTTTTTTTIAAPPQGMKTILVLIDHMLVKKTLALTQGEVNSIAMLVLMNDLHKNKLLTKIVIKRLAMPTMGMTTIPKTTSTTTWRHMVMLPPKVVKSNQGVISGIILAMTKGAEGNHNMIKMRGP